MPRPDTTQLTHPWVECPCGKLSYRTPLEADLAAQVRSAATKTDLRWYKCKLSDSYHLTSEAPRHVN